MVAYSFQKRFAPRIQSRVKIGTIRAHRKRHARPGEALQLYQGMRTKHCTKIVEDPICKDVTNITIDVGEGGISSIRLVFERPFEIDPSYYDEFAILDGFDNLADMSAFWIKSHGPGLFEGVWVTWDTHRALMGRMIG